MSVLSVVDAEAELDPELPDVLPELATGLETPPVGVETVPCVREALVEPAVLVALDPELDAEAEAASEG